MAGDVAVSAAIIECQRVTSCRACCRIPLTCVVLVHRGINLGVLRCGATRSLTAPGVVPRRELSLGANQLTSTAGTTWPATLQ